MIRKLFIQLRSALLTGALVMAPLALTIIGVLYLFNTIDKLSKNLIPVGWHLAEWRIMDIPGVGVVLTLVILTLFGLLTRYYAGKRIIRLYESLLVRMPLISGVYQGLKQFIETLFSSRGRQFSEVVLIEYPRRDVYCLAFVTNRNNYLQGKGRLVSLFLPTTPNPTSGFFLLVPEADVHRLDMNVEEAFKLIMSAGLVAPDSRQILPFNWSLGNEEQGGASEETPDLDVDGIETQKP